jgi:hypothetical protein
MIQKKKEANLMTYAIFIALFLAIGGVSEPVICEAQQIPDISFEIQVQAGTVEMGRQPVFHIVLSNRGEIPIRVVDFSKRRDLSARCLDIEITARGEKIPYGIIISDPWPVLEDDYLELPSKRSVSFLIDSYVRIYRFEHPGTYEISASFWNFPFWKISSKPSTFTVVQ